MKLHEYQAKELLRKYDVPVSLGSLASTSEVAYTIATDLSSSVVIKAQIHAGGRGKAGGIKIATNPNQAKQIAKEMLGSRLYTIQTGKEGAPVNAVLVDRVENIKREFYLSITVDANVGKIAVIASSEGGVEIETVAQNNPDAIVTVHTEPLFGLLPYQAKYVAHKLNIPQPLVKNFQKLLLNLYKMFLEVDCSLIEINPLVLTENELLLALDAKVDIENDSLYRHPDYRSWYDLEQLNNLEKMVYQKELSYVKLEGGQVGCMVNGAGLAMATMDIIKLTGAEPANFLDVGGSTSVERIKSALEIILSDSEVRVIFVNLFAGIARADLVARGLIEVWQSKKVNIPCVAVLRGTNSHEAKDMIENSGIKVTMAVDLEAGAKLLGEIVKKVAD